MGFAEGSQPALDQGRVGQHPPVQGGVVDLQAALQKQLFDVAIAERVAQIPRDGLQDQRRLEVPALEVVLRPALQLLGNRAQDQGPPPVRRCRYRPQAQRAVNAKTLRHALPEYLAPIRLLAPLRSEFRLRLYPPLPSGASGRALRCLFLALSSASVARFQPYLPDGRYQASLGH